MSKGQVISGDFFLSAGVFLLVLSAGFFMYDEVGRQVRESQERGFMNVLAASASDLLIKTEGSPADWNAANVRSIGLVSGDFINGSKAREFVLMDYGSARTRLGVMPNEMLVTFSRANGTLISVGGTPLSAGVAPDGDADVVKVQRTTIIEDGGTRIPAVISIVLWRSV